MDATRCLMAVFDAWFLAAALAWRCICCSNACFCRVFMNASGGNSLRSRRWASPENSSSSTGVSSSASCLLRPCVLSFLEACPEGMAELAGDRCITGVLVWLLLPLTKFFRTLPRSAGIMKPLRMSPLTLSVSR